MAGLLSRYFGFTDRSADLATEIRARFTTFMVMARPSPFTSACP